MAEGLHPAKLAWIGARLYKKTNVMLGIDGSGNYLGIQEASS